MNYYEHHIGDYAAATGHLTLIEDAIYSRLIRRYYLDEKPLPVDAKKVARLAGARSEEEIAAVNSVLEEFFTLEADGWHNSRCDEEIGKFLEKQAKARASGIQSGVTRRMKSEQTNKEIRAARMAAAKQKGTHTREEWLALTTACGHQCVKCGAQGHQDRDHIVPIYQGGSDGIENIQPLCARCNASKGPEAVDYRPNDWRTTVQRLLSESGTLQTPDTRHQKEKEESCTKRSRISYPDDFEQFWQEYPTDPLMSKKQALAAWKRLGEEDREAARAAIQAFRSHCRSNPDYRPVHAERFLSQRRFDGFGAAPPGSARIDPDLARLAEIEAAARAKRQEGLNG